MTPLPVGTRLEADPSLRRRDAGRLLIGGSPLRFIRVTAAGAATVSGWFRGQPIGSSAGATALARRLIATGMAHPVVPGDGGETVSDGESPRLRDGESSVADVESPVADVTVVIPVKDDPSGLAATLDTLPTGVAVLVVDDGSETAVDRALIDAIGTLIRRPEAGGPGVARQTALPSVTTPLVAFVDAGVRLEPTTLHRLVRWFADPTIVAVGPRIASTPGSGPISRYEVNRSPLDLGPNPAAVRPASPVTYLPTACLLVRGDALDQVSGFDEALRWGEDVDLVWRLGELGSVRFDPTVVVHHPPRSSLRAFVDQRVGYGSAAGPLAIRHPGRLAPVKLSGWSLAVWVLAAAGRPGSGFLLAAATAFALKRKLAGTVEDSEVEATLLAGRGHLSAGRALARSATRVWWPLTAVAWAIGARRSALGAVALSILDRWLTADGSAGERVLDVGLGLVDDAAYGVGVWRGALSSRTVGPLVPDLAEWPPRDSV